MYIYYVRSKYVAYPHQRMYSTYRATIEPGITCNALKPCGLVWDCLRLCAATVQAARMRCKSASRETKTCPGIKWDQGISRHHYPWGKRTEKHRLTGIEHPWTSEIHCQESLDWLLPLDPLTGGTVLRRDAFWHLGSPICHTWDVHSPPSGHRIYSHFDESILMTSNDLCYSATCWKCQDFGSILVLLSSGTLVLSHAQNLVAQSHFSHGGWCRFSALLPSSLKHNVPYNYNIVLIMFCSLTRYWRHMI